MRTNPNPLLADFNDYTPLSDLIPITPSDTADIANAPCRGVIFSSTLAAPSAVGNVIFATANSDTATPAAKMTSGTQYTITTVGTTNWTSLGAATAAVGTTFTYNGATVTGIGGTAAPTITLYVSSNWFGVQYLRIKRIFATGTTFTGQILGGY